MRIRFCLLAVFLLTASAVHAELLDRIAITVGQEVITEQQIYDQLRIAAFLNGAKPEFTQEKLRETADRMVMQRLVMQDMRSNGYPLPTSEEVDDALKQSRQANWGSQEAFLQAARDAGLPERALKDFLSKMVATAKYIDFRFRPAVRVSDSAVLERYQSKYNPLDPNAGEPPPFEDVKEALENEIAGEQLESVMDSWLEDARARAGVRYKPEVIP